ncbi:hypothetical protein LTR94_038370, partial [Friedmanniomyces endolithicus]
MRTVRDRDAVGGAKAAEVPALHSARETLTDGFTLDVHLLADQEVLSRQLSPHVQQTVRINAELGDIGLGFNLGLRE